MANISNIANDVRTAACLAFTTSVDGGPAAGRVRLYTAAKALMLVEITLNDAAFASPVNGVAALSLTPANPYGTAVAEGTAAVAEFRDSTGAVKFDGTVTISGGGGSITLASTTIVLGARVELTGGNFTYPAS